MRNLKISMLASASALVLAATGGAAVAQVLPPLFGPPDNLAQTLPSLTVNGANTAVALSQGVPWSADPSSQAEQIATVTANTIGAPGAQVGLTNLLPDFFGITSYVTQLVTNVNINESNFNQAYAPTGPNSVSGTQVITTTLNDANVSLPGGVIISGFIYDPVLLLRQANSDSNGTLGVINSKQTNTMVAGYAEPFSGNFNVGSGPASINGQLQNSSGQWVNGGYQQNSFSLNTASIGVDPTSFTFFGFPITLDDASAIVVQKPGSGTVSLNNFADAGSASLPPTPPTPPNPPFPTVDPLISNLTQIDSATFNTVAVTSGNVDLLAPTWYTSPVANGVPTVQLASANQGIGNDGLTWTLDIGNSARAVTWSTSTVASGIQYDPAGIGGVGNVSLDAVNQVVSVTANSVTGAGNVAFGGSTVGFGPVSASAPFSQVADYGSIGTGSTGTTGLGIVGGSANAPRLTADFSTANFVDTAPSTVAGGALWSNSLNTELALTNFGLATISNGQQATFVSLNTVNLDNSVKATSTAAAQPNTTTVAGNLTQDLLLAPFGTVSPGEGFNPNTSLDLTNFAAADAVTAGAAKIDTLVQVASFNGNSFSAGAIGQVGLLGPDSLTVTQTATIVPPSADTSDGALVPAQLGPVLANSAIASSGGSGATLNKVTQDAALALNTFSASGKNGVLNLTQSLNMPAFSPEFPEDNAIQPVITLGNQQIAQGKTATISGGVQLTSLSVNSATVGTLSAGSTISQNVVGLTVNSANLATANGVTSASISGLVQQGGVTVNAIK